jgi:hypothetical protein
MIPCVEGSSPDLLVLWRRVGPLALAEGEGKGEGVKSTANKPLTLILSPSRGEVSGRRTTSLSGARFVLEEEYPFHQNSSGLTQPHIGINSFGEEPIVDLHFWIELVSILVI